MHGTTIPAQALATMTREQILALLALAPVDPLQARATDLSLALLPTRTTATAPTVVGR